MSNPTAHGSGTPESLWRSKIHEVIYEAETPAGRSFDVALLWVILASVAVVMFESVEAARLHYGAYFRIAEWLFTVLFTFEYVLRIVSVKRPLRYVFSFYGLVDLLAIVPTYASVLLPGTQSLLVIRALRLLRLFRILKLTQFVHEADFLLAALAASRFKIIVFLGWICGIVTILGAIMYLIEGPENGFTSVPRAVYWAIITMTTVGYGNVVPQTAPGQMLAALVMILGYCIIAVPTGIVTAEITRATAPSVSTEACSSCSREGHDTDAEYCKHCGAKL